MANNQQAYYGKKLNNRGLTVLSQPHLKSMGSL
jgi:hypothetical protein